MNRTMKLSLSAVFALALAACGGSSKSQSQPVSARIGAAGGTIQAPSVKLSVPAGALSQEVEIRITEVEPGHGIARFELEPQGLALAAKATLSVDAPAGAGPTRLVEVENEVEHALENEHEMSGAPGREAELDHLGEVELREMSSCSPACDAGLECDDGACKADDAGAAAVAGNCPAGQELDVSDGICKAHGGKP